LSTFQPPKYIPKVGPSPNPWDGLGKNIFIKCGVPDNEIMWSDHASSSSDSDLADELMLDRMAKMEITMAEMEEVVAQPKMTFLAVEEM